MLDVNHIMRFACNTRTKVRLFEVRPKARHPRCATLIYFQQHKTIRYFSHSFTWFQSLLDPTLPFAVCSFFSQVNRLGLPVTEAEARLLVVEYGGAAAGGVCVNGDVDGQEKGGGEGQLSLDDFDFMVRRQSRLSISRPTR